MASIRRRTESCPVIFFIRQHTHTHTFADVDMWVRVQIFVILLRTQALINKQLDKSRERISLEPIIYSYSYIVGIMGQQDSSPETCEPWQLQKSLGLIS